MVALANILKQKEKANKLVPAPQELVAKHIFHETTFLQYSDASFFVTIFEGRKTLRKFRKYGFLRHCRRKYK